MKYNDKVALVMDPIIFDRNKSKEIYTRQLEAGTYYLLMYSETHIFHQNFLLFWPNREYTNPKKPNIVIEELVKYKDDLTATP